MIQQLEITLYNRLVTENRPEYEHTLEGADEYNINRYMAQ